MTDWITDLCRHAGIGSCYHGFDGQPVSVSKETRIAILHALGYDAGSEGYARDILLHARHEDSERPVPAELITTAGQSTVLAVTRPVEWHVEAEGTAEILATGLAHDKLKLPVLPMGIHRLILWHGSQGWKSWILARPARAMGLCDLTSHARGWGVTTALYGLTDGGGEPLGTYQQLGRYAAALADHGADFIGINPVHAMGQARPGDVTSPYSPSHRGFLNTWYVAPPDSRTSDKGFNPEDLIDYPAALKDNANALKTEYARFKQMPEAATDHRDYLRFQQDAGRALADYALFEMLADKFGTDWREWPAKYRMRHPEDLAAFSRSHGDDIAFHQWAQWLADRQLGQARMLATDAGMRIGLYLDLAVGPRPGGAETWEQGSTLVTGATLGAPPDPLAPAGQNWGLAPQSPRALRAQGYAGFARLLRSVMRHAGMIRIDHVIGLMRSFWIPEGSSEGAFVEYCLDALLAVVAIESARSETIVIGEDLGLVPMGLRYKLAASGIYGLDILQFMRDDKGGLIDTRYTREKAICAFGTHDTPTIIGYFTAEDAKCRHEIGATGSEAVDLARRDREAVRQQIGAEDIVSEIHRSVARSRSELVAVQLDDVAERKHQQNLPGTTDEYPNWRRQTPYSVDDIRGSRVFARLGADMQDQGRANTMKTEKDHDRPNCSNHTH